MAEAIAAVTQGGRSSLHELLPTSFNWGLFPVALAAMAVPVVDVGRQLTGARRKARVMSASDAGRPTVEGSGG